MTTHKERTAQKIPNESGSISYGTRLTLEQRDLVSRAAELRGWSVANLIRVAALEKAAHIINTSRPNRFDFRKTARRVAQQLVEPRASMFSTFGGAVTWESWKTENAGGGAESWYTEAERLNADEAARMEQAIELGGTEFLRLVVDYCREATTASRADLPEPINPSNIEGDDKE